MISRRDFLKLSGLALGGLTLPPVPLLERLAPEIRLGRVTWSTAVTRRPSRAAEAEAVAFLPRDTVIRIHRETLSDDDWFNRVWYETDRGFVYSGNVQPVTWELQTPRLNIPKEGLLGEVRVPFSVARVGAGTQFNPIYRYYHGTTHWVKQALTDANGLVWYGLWGDRLQRLTWVDARHIYLYSPAELEPLSPQATDKRIEIALEKQIITCYEGNTPVLTHACATGPLMRIENGRRIYSTPQGEWQVIRKRPSRHMAADDLASDGYDLPGVPWVTYFHWWGVAIHGTYWHNDYGRPRSHGCINVPNEIARWIYRWTTPVVPYAAEELAEKGTPVTVIL